MNNKILILLFVTSLELSFEFLIPINKKIGTIKKSIVEFIENEYGFSIKNSGKVLIIDKETGNILDENRYIKDSNVKNGTKLLLI